MKNVTTILLCCYVLLTACDKSGEPESGADLDTSKADPAASDTSTAIGNYVDQAADDLDNAVESAKDAAVELAADAREQAGAAVDTVKNMSAAAVEKSTRMVTAVTQEDTSKGESIYKNSCFACHGAGVAGAPKLDDSVAWDVRLTQGIAVLSQHAIEGFKGATGYMPPKGGYSHLSDEDVTQAVKYMVSQVQ